MTIGIDARFFGPKAKGLGRYAQKLIEGLEQADKQNEYLVFLLRANFDEYQPQNPRFKKVLADYRWYSLGEQLFFPWQLYRHKIDLMHFTHFNAPVLYSRPYIVTIHDLILQRFSTAKATLFDQLKYLLKNLGYKIVIRLVVGRAQKIIAVSQFVKKDIIRSFGVAEKKISVIYEGAPDLTSGKEPIANSSSVFKKYNIQQPYLLYVGNAYPHKNLARLIEAFKILRDDKLDLRLVLVGEEDYFYRQLMGKIEKDYHLKRSARLDSSSRRGREGSCESKATRATGRIDSSATPQNDNKKIIFTGFVPEEELRRLYAGAALYVFPSLCEGFGLPPLEAMAQGLAVVASKATCLPEVLGQAAHYFDGESPEDMAAKIREVLSDEILRQKLIAQGFEQIKKYSWQKMAEETRKSYTWVDKINA